MDIKCCRWLTKKIREKKWNIGIIIIKIMYIYLENKRRIIRL
jgi:hypothetical protein